MLKTAKDALGEDRVYAITAISPIFIGDEIENAKAIAKELNIRHILVETHQLDSPLFISNTPRRCYYCKRQILERIKEIANDLGISKILDGTNMDDISESEKLTLEISLEKGKLDDADSFLMIIE